MLRMKTRCEGKVALLISREGVRLTIPGTRHPHIPQTYDQHKASLLPGYDTNHNFAWTSFTLSTASTLSPTNLTTFLALPTEF
jgi:hypothetical protein